MEKESNGFQLCIQKRIGIVLSVAWLVGMFGYQGYQYETTETRLHSLVYARCFDRDPVKPDDDTKEKSVEQIQDEIAEHRKRQEEFLSCDKFTAGDDAVVGEQSGVIMEAAELVGIVPLGWLGAYASLWVYGWIMQGRRHR